MDRAARVFGTFSVIVLVALATGCGGGGGSGKDDASGGGGAAAGPFEVVRSEPAHGARPGAVARVRLVFNHDLDPATILFDLGDPARSSFVVLEQAPASTAVSLVPGTISLGAREIIFTAQGGFVGGFTYGVLLTSALRDSSGATLTTGAVSGPLTIGGLPGLVFQAVFTVAAGTGGRTTGGSATGGATTGGATTGGATTGGATRGGGTTGATTPSSLVTSFVAEPGSDVWYIDFVTAGTFPSDMRARGLASGDATVDAWARAHVIQRVFSYTGVKYFRNPDGSGVPGTSYAISFVSARPAGTPGVHFSRHCIGGSGGGWVLGESWYDPGNRDYEDNSPASGTGVFSSSIDGTDSTLFPALRTSELCFLDGSYALGQGTASEDARFLAIREALLDWGTAIGCVLAHEVGHSVGLDHDGAGSWSIMSASLSEWMLSNTGMRFSNTARSRLDNNLGYTQ